MARIEQEGARYEIVLPDADEDYIQKSILNSGAPYELAMLRDMRVRLTSGDRVLDIGANVGNHTLYLAVLARARVIAFEPNVGLTAALEASVARNGLGDAIDVRTMGLGRAAGAAEFARAMPDNLGAQSLALGKGAIEVATLDSLGIEGPVRMIKIDVEGMEVDVLEGAGVLIGRDRPLLYIESLRDRRVPGGFALDPEARIRFGRLSTPRPRTSFCRRSRSALTANRESRRPRGGAGVPPARPAAPQPQGPGGCRRQKRRGRGGGRPPEGGSRRGGVGRGEETEKQAELMP